MGKPIGGYGAYVSLYPTDAITYTAQAIELSSAGFTTCVNYNAIRGSSAQVLAMLDVFHTYGLTMFISLSDRNIWQLGTYATSYPVMYAESGNAATAALFLTYIVNALKGHAAIAGWYVGDEALPTEHTLFKVCSDAVRAADNTHPRMFVEGGGSPTTSCCGDPTNNASGGPSPYYDCAEIIGDDYYWNGNNNDAYAYYTTAQEAVGCKNYAVAHSVMGTFVLQAYSTEQFYTDSAGGSNTPWPPPKPWFNAAEYAGELKQLEDNFTTQYTFHWAYYRILISEHPGLYFSRLKWALFTDHSVPFVEPRLIARAVFAHHSSAISWGRLESSSFLWDTRLGNAQQTTTGAQFATLTNGTGKQIVLCGRSLDISSEIVAYLAVSTGSTAGIVFRYANRNNYMRVELVESTINIVSVVAGGEKTIASANIATAGASQFIKVNDTGSSITVTVWLASQGCIPGSATTLTASYNKQGGGRFGVYGNLLNTSAVLILRSFSVWTYDQTTDISTPTNTHFYLSPTGNDGGNGTADSPWLTLPYAITFLTPGSTLHFLPGTYDFGSTAFSTFAINNGTSTNPVTFVSDVKHGAIIKNTGQPYAMYLNASYTIIDGFVVTSSYLSCYTGIQNTGSNVTIRNCEVYGIQGNPGSSVGGAGITIYNNANSCVISGNFIHDISVANNTFMPGIRSYGASTLIERNIIDKVGAQPIQIRGASSNQIIRNNLLITNSTAITIQTDVAIISGIHVYNNIVVANNAQYIIQEIFNGSYATGPNTYEATLVDTIAGSKPTYALQNLSTVVSSLDGQTLLTGGLYIAPYLYSMNRSSACIATGIAGASTDYYGIPFLTNDIGPFASPYGAIRAGGHWGRKLADISRDLPLTMLNILILLSLDGATSRDIYDVSIVDSTIYVEYRVIDTFRSLKVGIV